MTNSNKNESISFVIDRLLPAKYRAFIYPLALVASAALWITGKVTASEVSETMESIATWLGIGSTALATINRPHQLHEKEN